MAPIFPWVPHKGTLESLRIDLQIPLSKSRQERSPPMKMLSLFAAALAIATPAVAGVSVVAPINNSNVATSVQYVANATTTCAKGVSAMGIYTAPYVLAYTV